MAYTSFREPDAAPAPPRPGPLRRWVLAGVAVVVIIGAAAAVYLSDDATKPSPSNAAAAAPLSTPSPSPSASVKAAAKATPKAPPKASPKAPGTGWVPVDQAAWKAQVVAYKAFFPAEDYHQDFLVKNPNYPYIVYNDLPKVRNFQKTLPALYQGKPVLVSEAR